MTTILQILSVVACLCVVGTCVWTVLTLRRIYGAVLGLLDFMRRTADDRPAALPAPVESGRRRKAKKAAQTRCVACSELLPSAPSLVEAREDGTSRFVYQCSCGASLSVNQPLASDDPANKA